MPESQPFERILDGRYNISFTVIHDHISLTAVNKKLNFGASSTGNANQWVDVRFACELQRKGADGAASTVNDEWQRLDGRLYRQWQPQSTEAFE